MVRKNVDRYIHSYSIKKLIIKPIPYFDSWKSDRPKVFMTNPGPDPGFLKGGGASQARIQDFLKGGGVNTFTSTPPPPGHCLRDVIHPPKN